MSGILKRVFTLNTLRFVLTGVLAFISFSALATATSGTLSISDIQKQITTGVSEVSKIIMDVATISGAGFVFASFFKFHQHKQNPTQVPLSNGIVLLLIGAALCVFPHLIGTGSQAIFGKPISKAGSATIAGIVADTSAN